MATRWARVVRGIVASLFATFVAGFAHIVGGGSMPSLAGVALVLALCVPASILLAGRTISTVRLAIAVVLSQAGFHLLFWLTDDSSAGPLPHALGGMHGMAGMTGGGGMPAAAGVSGAGVSGAAMSGLNGASVGGSMTASGWMWAAHALAAALTVVALRYGEGAFWALVSAARLTVIRFVKSIALTVEFPRPTEVGFIVRFDRRDAPFLWSGLRHRGPPAFAPASA